MSDPRALAVAAVLRSPFDAPSAVRSVDHHRGGESAVVLDAAGSIQQLNCAAGAASKVLRCTAAPLARAVYTHHEHCVLLAPAAGGTVSELCLFDNQIVREFRAAGSRGPIADVAMAPIDDQFLTAGGDNRVVLWSFRTHNPVAVMDTPAPAVVAFDNTGAVFAVATGSSEIKLFDAKKYESGAFDTLRVPAGAPISALAFSPDGTTLLVSTASHVAHLIDSFNGTALQVLELPRQEDAAAPPSAACFSPDGLHVFRGDVDGSVQVWEAATGAAVVTLAAHAGHVNAVQWNPRFEVFVSACENVCLWQVAS